jgi:hypothetical protein
VVTCLLIGGFVAQVNFSKWKDEDEDDEAEDDMAGMDMGGMGGMPGMMGGMGGMGGMMSGMGGMGGMGMLNQCSIHAPRLVVSHLRCGRCLAWEGWRACCGTVAHADFFVFPSFDAGGPQGMDMAQLQQVWVCSLCPPMSK